MRRVFPSFVLAAGFVLLSGAPSLALHALTTRMPPLVDSIAAGIVRGTGGFESSTVGVPDNSYVTYLVRTDSALAGSRLQVWTDTGKGWVLTTTRLVGKDGTVHYFARVHGVVHFWAKLTGSGGDVLATSHGRTAAATSNGTLIVRVGCDEVAPVSAGARTMVDRTVAAKIGSRLVLTVCSTPSAGFTWSSAAIDDTHLALVGHTTSSPGADGNAADSWIYRVRATGTGRATLVYSQPWTGGEKATWVVSLVVTGQR